MNLVLTAAGKYERFRRFSYEIPKYLLPIKNRTVLHHVLEGFGDIEVLFVGNKRDIRFASVVESVMFEMCGRFSIKWIEDTSGQAQTLLEATEGIDEQILVHNIDTILLRRNNWWFTQEGEADCLIDVFRSSNRDYSYVIDKNNIASEIREKSVISDKASSGCYLFDSRRVIERYLDQETQYISEIINKMIKDGYNVKTTEVHKASDTIVLGTPEEYLANIDSDKIKVA